MCAGGLCSIQPLHTPSLVPHAAPLPPVQVNERDTVATVPRLMGYAHVGHSVTLKGDGQVEVHLNTTERFGEGLGLPDLTPAVGAVVAAKVGSSLLGVLA